MHHQKRSHYPVLIVCVGIVLLSYPISRVSAHFTGYNHFHPDTIDVMLCPGDCHTETLQVDLEKPPPQMDIMFSMDVTSSMDSVLTQMKTDALSIMTNIRTLIPDTNYGVISHRDYPDYNTPMCGYSAVYGDTGDWAYRLEHDLTSDLGLVNTAIDLLTASGSGDLPESYTRVLYESYADPAISWRFGAKKILLGFMDNYPHDCDVNACLAGPPLSTGLDPGRDETGGTADDLPILDLLDTMLKHKITLLSVITDPAYYDFWDCMARRTNGQGVGSPSPADIATAVYNVIADELTRITILELTAESLYVDWLYEVTPPFYFSVFLSPPKSISFDITVCMPPGTPPGTPDPPRGPAR